MIKLSLSTAPIADKDAYGVWGRVRYRETETDIDTFMIHISKGYAFTSLMGREEFGVKEKTDYNWSGSQLLVYDIDNVQNCYEMGDFVTTLTFQPTIAYTSQNNHVEKGGKSYCKFRLLYIFDEVITSEDVYHGIYDYIQSTFDKSFFDSSKTFDNTARSVSHQFAGNPHNIEMIRNDITYSLADFKDCETVSSVQKQKAPYPKDKSIKTKLELSDSFIRDLDSMSPSSFLEHYGHVYRYQSESHVDFNNYGYAILDDDYIKMFHAYDKETGQPHIFKDGEQRRKKLYMKGLLHKKIKSDIGDEELVYNLLFDRYHFFDNSDNVLNNRKIIEIAENVKNSDVCINAKRPKIKIDKGFCKDNGITPNQYRPMVMKEINDALISKFYNPNLSVKENLERLNRYGIKIGKTKLYEFCRERKISTKGNKKYGYKPTEGASKICSECELVKAVISRYKVY